ncbi:MAG: TonB-dependent receptor [Desulfobacteraceae bacterium]|jgi:vitamin B12 transporter
MKTIRSYLFFLLLSLSLLLCRSVLAEDNGEETNDTKETTDIMRMDPITVTGSVISPELLDKSNSITIITRENIEAASATTVDELLRTSAGLEVWKPQGVFGHASRVRMRGFASSRATLFLKDGMPVDRISCGETLHNEIPLDTVERVEVIRGAAGSVSGKGAMGGVINIVTRKTEAKPHANLSVTYGTYNTRSVDFGAGGKLTDRFNIGAGYTHFDSNGYFAWSDYWIADRVESMNQNLLSWNNPAEGWSVKDNYLVSLEKQTREADTVTASLSGLLGENFRFNAGYTWWKNDSNIGYRYGYINQLRNRLNLEFENKGLFGLFDLAGNLFILDETVEFSQPVLPSPDMDAEQGKQTWLVQGNKSDIPLNDYGGMVSMAFDAGKHNTIKFTTDHRYAILENRLYDGLTNETISISQAEQYRWGITLQDTLRIGSLTVDAGVRYRGVETFDFFYENRFEYIPYEVDSLSDTQIDPWIGITWDINKSTMLRMGVSRSSTFAPLSYLLGDYERPPGKTIIGNPYLGTEYAMDYEIGMEKRIGEWASVQFTTYYNDIKDWMQEVSAADPAYSSVSVRWENIEEAVSRGIEVAADIFPTDTLRLYANYTLNISEVIRFEDKHHNYDNKRLEDRRFPDQAEHKANLGVEWFHPGIAKFNVSVRYSGPRYYDIENTIKLDAYTTLDIKIVKDIGRYLNLALEAKDIFDEAWQETAMHNTPGRTIFGKVTVKY